jgi:hypothetical protein
MSVLNSATRLALTLSLAAATSAPAAQPFTATYDFAQVTAASGTTDPTPPPTATGVTFGAFTATGVSANPNATVRFSFTSQPLGGVNGTNDFAEFTGSLSPTAYFEVALTPLSLIQLQLDSIAFSVQRSGTGIRSYAVRSSLDGYAANLPASITPANANLSVGPGNEFRIVSDATTTAQNGSTIILGSPFAGLTAPINFRFYGWNAEGSGGTFSIDNVVFSGNTDNVPEPTTTALLLVGLTALGIRRRAQK